MAVVDSLLGLIASQGADALILPPGEAPSLEKGGQPTALSMPYPGDEIIDAMIEEVTSAQERAALAGGTVVETRYVAGDGSDYAVKLEPRGGRARVVFRKASAVAAAQSPPPNPEPAIPPAPRPPVAAPAPQPAPRSSPPPAAPSASRDGEGVCEVGPFVSVFARAAMDDASDLFLSVGRPARLRVGADLLEVGGQPVREADLERFIAPALWEGARAELEASGSADIAVVVELDGARHRFRGNIFRQQHGLALALRPIRRSPPTTYELNLPDGLLGLVGFASGLVLMTGATGSGKSTTLVALLEHLNRTTARHVITLEDPIEYEYRAERALIHQREVGRHVDGFANGLRAALRESPDVILLGEMRDRDTIAAALTAAETGHLVLSTLHAAGAPMAVDRIIDVFPEHQQGQVRLQLASVLRAVVTQQLIPTVQPPNRVPAIELLLNNIAVATKIREGRGHQLRSEIQKGRAEGMIPLEASLADLVRTRLVREDVAASYARDPTVFRQLLRGS